MKFNRKKFDELRNEEVPLVGYGRDFRDSLLAIIDRLIEFVPHDWGCEGRGVPSKCDCTRDARITQAIEGE